MSGLTTEGKQLMKDFRTSWKFKLYTWKRLPSLGFWGVSINSIEEDHCSAKVPYRWSSQNPFKSIYFSALAGCAEISTGALMLCYLSGKGKYSMLVVDFKMRFLKKSTTSIVFTCNDGYRIADIVEEAEKTGEGQKIDLTSTGVDANGVEVAVATVSWSIKKKR